MSSKPDVAQLYAEYSARLRRYLFLKTGEPDLSADLAQECFARLLARSDQPSPENVQSYLYAMATHLLIDHRRNHHQARTDAMPDSEMASLHDPAGGPDMQAEARRQLARLQEGLAELPLRTRQIFQLCRFEGMSYQDAARHLGISTSSVQKHLAMALEFLRERLGDRP
ncbi:sigma-70 family RNA polymerase sigma factor [Bordetella petrii]|uniref:sigma-70 family RNA polymerase sigma factor n=1 Tax=Bordetella petrii TaxID=94624 RepID=UPI001A979247|nr:RNA polymerase sigma factor [Bordetella petrii]